MVFCEDVRNFSDVTVVIRFQGVAFGFEWQLLHNVKRITHAKEKGMVSFGFQP